MNARSLACSRPDLLSRQTTLPIDLATSCHVPILAFHGSIFSDVQDSVLPFCAASSREAVSTANTIGGTVGDFAESLNTA